ncbi:MAG: ribonucleoside-diphosphate reductase subunit alpha [Candidatus Latescibacteria bacterium]|nr:ribonucleoside-diphosphate reductase subunit alpha [Candidatus Latescibacterota bacterium]MBT5829428.1 ribonucleoside-diphosphate reductase subunit alpha [Candidatus Latescibacterota bacterium]
MVEAVEEAVQASVDFMVRKRDGRVVAFDRSLIERAISAAFRAELGLPEGQALPPKIAGDISDIANAVIADVSDDLRDPENAVDVERVQDKVEIQMMRTGHFTVARRYIVYREDHKKARVLSGEEIPADPNAPKLRVKTADGKREPLDANRIRAEIFAVCDGYDEVDAQDLLDEIYKSLYDDIQPSDIERAMILAARSRVEKEPAYGKVAMRILLNVIYRHAVGMKPIAEDVDKVCREGFVNFIETGIENDRLDPTLRDFDMVKLSAALKPERDQDFEYLGMQTIFDRYLLHVDDRRIETPQYFWMRVAMGLSVDEANKEDRAIQFYEVLSSFRFVSATPTLFNSGTLHPQLSSCYLSTAQDDLEHIFKVVSDNAKLSKWAGGLGNDWTNVRATNSYISGTNGKSQGVIPFLKVVNDTAVAVNQGGKRKGAVCSYLETWHLDIEDFMELRKNTGDDRRRTHDMNTANWIPDLFMKRVMEKSSWTLFSPDEVPELHDLYGKAFEAKYTEYEKKAEAGELRQYRQIDAVQLWRKMLSMLFETGHPWITFKDPSNVRSPQDHKGVVHSSNLCTEILLNTSRDETAVCNLGSVNMLAHVKDGGLDRELLEDTIFTALRMLDNVIDINFYPTDEAATSNKRHRPVGLGLMGFQDALYKLRLPYDSDGAVEFADESMELISYYAILASTQLAEERGTYGSYEGSKWDRGMLPIDTLKLMAEERGSHFEVDMSARLDWKVVHEAVAKHGMRNSNVMAIAPTATISNISGVTQSIEPTYRNLFVKANLSGDFTVLNTHMVEALKAHGIWDDQMVDDLKYFDGSLAEIERVPDELKALYRTAFEVAPKWIIECGSRRQKWIDMGQSLNLYIAAPSGKALDDMYKLAWLRGLKTTYYLRSIAATQVEKSTMDINRRGVQPRWMQSKSASGDVQVNREEAATPTVSERLPRQPTPVACDITDGACESCQ